MNKKKIAGLFAASILLLGLGAYGYKKFVYVGVEKRINEITKMDLAERQAAVDKLVADGMINIQYTPDITVKGNVCEDFNIKNIENNKYPLKFKITDNDDNVIYDSKLIERGYELNGLEFESNIEKGEHEYKIYIGYDIEGNVQSAFPLRVKSV